MRRAMRRACRRLVRGRRWLATVLVLLLVVWVPGTRASAGEDPRDQGDSNVPGGDEEPDPRGETPTDDARVEECQTLSSSDSGMPAPLQCVLDVCDDEEEWWLYGTEDGPNQWVEEWKHACTYLRNQAGEYETAADDGVVWLDSAWCEAWTIFGVILPLAPVAHGLKSWCYGEQRQEAYEVLQTGGTVRISCSFDAALGADVLGVGEQDADAATHTFGYMQEVLKLLGWQPRTNVTIHPDAPDWWARELLLQHECHLATRYPKRCPSLEETARGTTPAAQPVPVGDWQDDYDPARDGRTPWQGNTTILPDPCVGEFPSNQYDIGYSSDGFVDIDDRVFGLLTNSFYSFGKGAMQVSFTFVNYAFEFDLVNGLGSVVDRAASTYDTKIVGDMRLADIAWLALVGWLALLVVTRRFTLALGEALVALAFLAVFTVILQDPRGYMEGAAGTMNDVSSSILQVDCDESPYDPGDTGFDGAREEDRVVSCAVSGLSRIQRELHRFFVHDPYLAINWGYDSADPEPLCEERIEHIIMTGPHGAAEWPRVYMAGRPISEIDEDDERRDAGGEIGPCQRAALYNMAPTWERLMLALLSGIMATLVACVLAAMGLTVLLAKFIVAMLFAVLPIAVALAVLPSSGRRLATAWMTTLLQAIVVSIGMSVILSLMMIALQTMAGGVRGLTLIERWITIIVVLMIVWYARKRFLTTMQTVASRIGDRLAHPDVAAAAAGGYGGGFGGGGYGGRPPGGSMFGVTRMTGGEIFGLATSAITTASTAGTFGLAAARVGAKAAGTPVRQTFNVLKARKAATRILRNNMGQLQFTRLQGLIADSVAEGGPKAIGGAGKVVKGGGGIEGENRIAKAVALVEQRTNLAADGLRGNMIRRQRYGWLAQKDDGSIDVVEEGSLQRRRRRKERRIDAGWRRGDWWRTWGEASLDRGPVGGARRMWQRWHRRSWDGQKWNPEDFVSPEKIHIMDSRVRWGVARATRIGGTYVFKDDHLPQTVREGRGGKPDDDGRKRRKRRRRSGRKRRDRPDRGLPLPRFGNDGNPLWGWWSGRGPDT